MHNRMTGNPPQYIFICKQIENWNSDFYIDLYIWHKCTLSIVQRSRIWAALSALVRCWCISVVKSNKTHNVLKPIDSHCRSIEWIWIWMPHISCVIAIGIIHTRTNQNSHKWVYFLYSKRLPFSIWILVRCIEYRVYWQSLFICMSNDNVCYICDKYHLERLVYRKCSGISMKTTSLTHYVLGQSLMLLRRHFIPYNFFSYVSAECFCWKN